MSSHLDYSTLTGLARDLAGLFWSDLSVTTPGSTPCT
jgi:hypothetical protein